MLRGGLHVRRRGDGRLEQHDAFRGILNRPRIPRRLFDARQAPLTHLRFRHRTVPRRLKVLSGNPEDHRRQ